MPRTISDSDQDAGVHTVHGMEEVAVIKSIIMDKTECPLITTRCPMAIIQGPLGHSQLIYCSKTGSVRVNRLLHSHE